MKIRPGRFLSIAIVATWVGVMSVHLSRSYGRSGTETLVDLSPSVGSTDVELTQRGVFYRGSRIGHIRERLTPLDDGYRAEQTGEFTLTLLGRNRKMKLEGSAETSENGRLREFAFKLATSSRRSPFETTVLGTVEGDELVLSIRSSRSERTERRPFDEPIVLPLNMYYSLASRGFTPGDTYRVRLFDPMTLSDGEAVIEVKETEIVRWGGREEEAFRLQTTFTGLTTTTWVSESGEVLQEETPLGWTLRKEAPGTSLSASDAQAAPDVLALSSVPAVGFSGDASDLSFARLKLRNFPDGFDALEGPRQRVGPENIMVVREVPPFEGREHLADEERGAALVSDAFIQADDPEIREHASGLTEGLSDVEKARALTFWVYENVTKSPTLSIPSAREVLDQRIGDCNEHTILFTALARSVELPTRIATGLAYTGGRFYYHAWPEVWVGRWLAVDPTFGQFPADPLHLRLLNGGLETQYEVLSLLGKQVTIEIQEIR